jgi:hypothetical protein
MQSRLLPILPFINYKYEGRYYKLIKNNDSGQLETFPIDIRDTLSYDLKNQDLDGLVNRLNNIFSAQNNSLVSLSNEFLPVDLDQAVSFNKATKTLNSKYSMINLFSIREVRSLLFSGFSHACLQFKNKHGFAYNINDVIFETDIEAKRAGFDLSEKSIPGARRPIVLDDLYLARRIELLKLNPLDTFIIDIKTLYDNVPFWHCLFNHITRSYEESLKTAEEWVKGCTFLGRANQKTKQGILALGDQAYKLSKSNADKIKEIEIQNRILYSKLGHYWG